MQSSNDRENMVKEGDCHPETQVRIIPPDELLRVAAVVSAAVTFVLILSTLFASKRQ